jgi:hypothetical protein
MFLFVSTTHQTLVTAVFVLDENCRGYVAQNQKYCEETKSTTVVTRRHALPRASMRQRFYLRVRYTHPTLSTRQFHSPAPHWIRARWSIVFAVYRATLDRYLLVHRSFCTRVTPDCSLRLYLHLRHTRLLPSGLFI